MQNYKNPKGMVRVDLHSGVHIYPVFLTFDSLLLFMYEEFFYVLKEVFIIEKM